MLDITKNIEAWIDHAQTFDGPHGTIAWWSEGEGRPLLLIHGFPTASWDWARIWPGLLASGRKLIALDMLGFGCSDKPRNHTYQLTEQADLHVQIVLHLGLTELDIVAHDYGVSVAQELIARQADDQLPFTIGSVVWLNGGLIPGEHRPRLIQTLLAAPLT